MTKFEKAIITAYTGILVGEFDDFHKYIETLLNRKIYTHELVDKTILEEIKYKSYPDFEKICKEVTYEN